ncbi:hypothetical protein AXG93_4139s1000 [Marchantia polymorpha subsp. ruderalis]|uniref:Terpene synthase n=1 Tax=Marchantia polymorpha subsp. ruderalis TaxID=1480154 RepID=A0A176VQD1_MARPO|nr:hypothetical protein AXG93_4139s1000 [Marchantia polymorpha subsp. ruderalis]
MAPLHSASTVLSIRSDFREEKFRRQLKSELYRNGSRSSLQNVYRIPNFQHRYPKAQQNPLTPEYTDIANDWLASFGVDKELVLDVKMGAFASALRDMWLEYIEAVPAEFASREAELLLDYLSACLWEQQNRKTREEITIPDFITLRRSTVCVMPLFVCTDLIIEHKRRKFAISHLPNSIFYGENMQNLLAASADCIAWHNDAFSFQKEIFRDGDVHNLVQIVSQQYICHSHTQAGALVIEILHDRIAEMELAYEKLKSEASPEFHPAIDRYMKTCRDWIPGTHEFHTTTLRYKISSSLSEIDENLKR